MIDSEQGGADPVLSFADGILDRYGVEAGGGALGAGPAQFAESIAGPLFGGLVPDTDDILGRMGRMGSIAGWLSYMDDRFGALALPGRGPGRGRGLGMGIGRAQGYRRFLSLDPYYLAVETDEPPAPGLWPEYRGGEAEAYEDPEAWKFWTLFPDAPAQEAAPAAAAPLGADGPWSRTGVRGRPVSAGLDPRLSGLGGRAGSWAVAGDGGAALSGGRQARGGWGVSDRQLPALSGGLRAAQRRGVGEAVGGPWGEAAEPSLVHLARIGLTDSFAAEERGAAPERRSAGLRSAGASAWISDPKLARMGVAGWSSESQAAPGSSVAGAWGATGGPSLLGRAPEWRSSVARDASLPTMPAAVAKMLPRGWVELLDPTAAPLRSTRAPLSAADAERLVRSAPEVGKWFRYVGRRAVADPGAPGAAGLPGARALDAAYVAWIDSVRAAAAWPTTQAAPGRADDDQAWTEQRQADAVLDALPPELRPAGRVLDAAMPGASGALARRLERQLPKFIRTLLQGRTERQAASAAGLPTQVADALARALTPALVKAGRFLPPGMAETAGQADSSAPWGSASPDVGRDAGIRWQPHAPYVPVVAAAVQRARARGLLTTAVSGLAPAQLLRTLTSGPASRGLPGPVLSLLHDVQAGAKAAMSAPRAAAALRALERLASAPAGRPAQAPARASAAPGPWQSLGAVPSTLRTQLLRAVISPAPPAASVRAALRDAGLPEDPAAAVAALLRAEAPSGGAHLLRRYLRGSGLGEWTPAGFVPADSSDAPGAAEGDSQGRGGLGGSLFAWAPGAVGRADADGLRGPALLRRLLDRAGWSDDAVGAEGFVPVVVGGQVRWLRRPDDLDDPALPQLERPEGRPALWPAAGEGGRPAAQDAGEVGADGAPGPADSDDAWVRHAMARAGVAQPALLLPPALRAALGGRALPASVIRSVLGMTAGAGKPASIEALVELLSPLGGGGGARGLGLGQGPWGTPRIGPLAPAQAEADRERARREALADRLGQTFAQLARRTGDGDAWPAAGVRLKGPRDEIGELLKRVDSGDRSLWKRIVTAMGPAATAAASGAAGEELTPDLLRSVLDEERELSAEGAGELIGGNRAKARSLRREADGERDAQAKRETRVRERAESEVKEQRERVEHERARRIEEEREAGEPLGERTLALVRSLFPKSVGRLGHAARRSAFPASLPGGDEPDLMLVAPTTEIIRREAAPLFKENPEADEVRAGASQAPTQQRGDDPARVEKFLSPEKIEEFARRSFEMLVDEIALDAERHGLDPHGWD